MDIFCGSHGRGQDGRGDRDAFMVEWATGKAWFPVEPEEEQAEVMPLGGSSAAGLGGFSVGIMFGMIAVFIALF